MNLKYLIECQVCHNLFWAKMTTAMYCGDDCKRAAALEVYRKRSGVVPKTCSHCREEFWFKGGANVQRYFCKKPDCRKAKKAYDIEIMKSWRANNVDKCKEYNTINYKRKKERKKKKNTYSTSSPKFKPKWNGRYCQVCGKKLYLNYFRCNDCLYRVHINDDWAEVF